MARIDEARERYESITEKLYTDKSAFADYLKYAGKFYKLPTMQTMIMFATNPNASMVADFDTWQQFGRTVQRGERSIAVLNGNAIKHYFDISQTGGGRKPYQWTLDKQTAQDFVTAYSKAENKEYKSLSSCVNAIGANAARDSLDSAIKALNISENDRAAFEKSFISITQYYVAARCELDSSFKYKNSPLDLAALDLVHSKAEAEKLTEYAQIAARPALLSMEKTINTIIAERSMQNGRNQTDLVRSGQEVLSRNNRGERQDVQARPENIRVSGAAGTRFDGRGTGNDERTDRQMGTGVAEVYDGELPGGNPVAARAAEMGADTPSDRQRSVGIVGTPSEAVRSEEPPTENLRGDRKVGENEGLHSGTRGNGADSPAAQRLNSDTTAEEENSPAVSVSADYENTYSEEWNYIVEKTKAVLGSDMATVPLCNSIFSKAFNYAYEEKTPIREIPENELNDIISETAGINKTPEIPSDIDKFYVSPEIEQVTWIYYNPDSSAGGQLVYNYLTYDDIFNAVLKDDPLEYLLENCKQETLDKGSAGFDEAVEEFMTDSEDISSREENYVDKLLALTEPRYAIFQLKDGEDLRDYRFTNTEYMQSHGMYVDRENYNRVYRGRLQPNETLDQLFQKFNINQPEDYHGRSLSVSDVICIKQDGKTTAHFVDSYGFTEVPDFTLSREERKARRTLTDNLTLLAENQIASDEMDTLADKLFLFEQAPKYDGTSGYWSIGAGMTADKFEDITTRYHNGEDIRAELAKGMFGKLDHIEFYDHSDGIDDVAISATKGEESITFRTDGGFEVTHSWETLGNALITAARKEFDRHEELDRQYREQQLDDVISKVRDGNSADISFEQVENSSIISNARRTEFNNAKLRFGEEYGFYITADTPTVKDGIISVLGPSEQVTKDYLSQNTDTVQIAEVNLSGRIEKYGLDIDFNKIDYIEVVEQVEEYLGGIDENGHEERDNFTLSTERTSLYAGRDGVLVHSELNDSYYTTSMDEALNRLSESLDRAARGNNVIITLKPTNGEEQRIDAAALRDKQIESITGGNPYVTVQRFSNVELDKIGLDSEKIYTIPEFNEALSAAETLYNRDENNNMRTDTISVSLHIEGKEYMYRPMLGAGYGTLSVMMNDLSLANASNIDVTDEEKQLVTEIEQSVEEKLFDPYAYDGSTSLEEERKSADAYNLDRFMQAYSEELTAFAVSHTQDEFKDYFTKRSAEALGEYDTAHPDETWHKSMLNNPDYIKFISDVVSTPFYNDIAPNEPVHEITAESEDFEEIPDEMLRDYPTTPDEPDEPIQMSLFGDFDEDTTEKKIICGVDVEAALKQDLIRHGSGFEDGKFRIEEYYKLHKGDTTEFPKFLSKEFGTGGHSGEGNIYMSDHDSKGICLTLKLDNGEQTKVNFSWKKVADRIARLIDNSEFITQADIDRRIKNAQFVLEHNSHDDAGYGRAVKILDSYGLLPHNTEPVIEGTPIYKVGDHIEIEHNSMPYSATITNIGDNFVSFKPDIGYSWEVEVTNKEIFEDRLRKDSRNAHLFSAEKQEQEVKLHDVVIDLTARPEREEKPVEKHDYTITDEHLGEGGAKAKFTANIDAIRTLKTIEIENRLATPEEQEVLAKYVGWGGLSQAFDGNNSQWTSEYKELRELLTDDEYTAAKGSVLNAHYTSPTVINAIYKGLETLGFEGGNILEPAMGVGNFFGTMPEEMRKNSHLHGVELDSISGRIARQLYQNADIQIKGFEKTEFSDNFFDAAVGNVPFGSYGVSDKRYNRENFFIHDYFLAKTLDKLAPGGVAALITTKGTMDKENPKVREYLARRGDLIGAIRLPNNAFKANAGTEVTTDILFFQKREKMAVELPDWCYVGKNNDGVPVNNYFIDHPEMVLGTMKQGVEFSMYGNSAETACVPIEGADLKEQLENAVSTLKLTNSLRKRTEQRDKEVGVIPATADVRNFTFAEVDGKMYFRENNIMTEVTETGKKLDRIKALNELRSTFREILSAQEQNCSDEQLAALQTTLNTQYDRFVKQYGYVNDSVNQQIFDRDDDYNSLCALEIIDEEKKTVEKSDFFTKRTVKYTAEITHVDTPQEAMQVSIDTRGKMDIPYMAALCGQEPQDVISVLKSDNLIYLNPEKATENPLDGWEETSEYLSGNVRAKLRTAEIFAKDNSDYQRNVAALTNVLPPKLEAGDISARIGVSWVDVEDYQKFIEEYAKARFFGEPLRRTVTGEYKIENKNWDSSAAATQIYGTSRMNAKTIFENLLNNRDIVVRDKITDPDGREHYEINKKETDLAQDKARQMKEAFKRWLWDDPARREKYVERYNNLFNCIVGRKFDGSHQTFPGMSPSISLKPHQLDAVMRAKFGGNTLLAHCVGAGKSFEMVAATMEKKRLGLINKACVVVPKHLVGQMANEWLRLYPQAKILTATEKDFDKNHRQKFIGRCCTGDYDAVIMSYEQFEKIPMSMEYRKNFIQREIDTMQSGIDELGGDYRSRANNRSSIKDLEREKKRLETRLQKLIEGGGKTKDTSLTFEQLGFDSLVVDEAHNYKNGLVVSKMNRVSGVQTTPAQKSEDILMKTQFLNENYGEKNIIFATGTPVSNSMTELYIMQRYLRPSLLANAGLQTFDDWASNFGEVVSKAELKPAGNGYRTKKRFAKFNNVPELMQMYKEFADIRTADMLNLPVPEIEGGKPQTIVAKPNDVQKAYMQVLAERSEAIHSGAVDPSVDNMLKITNEARLLGLDARCIVPNAENLPDSKVNLCIDKVMEVYEQTAEQKGVQAIFCDIAVNSDDGRFSVYNYIKEGLVRRGVPAEEICAAGDAETQKQRNEMYAQLRSGTKRIVLASTSKMGTGANIQTKLAALHNLDIPWKPSDIEQRNGRIIRQGNEFDKVGVYNYVTENTFDAYLMNIIVTKQRFISQLMSGDTTARSCEDVDEAVLNYSEMQALASGDERIKEKIELDGDVARLRLLESEHYNAQYRLDDTIRNAEKWIGNLTANITAAKADIAFAAEHKPLEDDFKIEIGGKVYTERKAAGEALQKAAIKVMAEVGGNDRHPVGTFCGFQLAIEKIHNGFTVGTGISLRNKLTYTADMDITGDIGNITRLENLFAKGLERKLSDLEEKLSRTQTDLQEAQAAKGKPFEHAEELATKSARLEQLNRELEVGLADEVIMDEGENKDEVQSMETHSSHEQTAPDSRTTPPKHKR